MGNCMKTEAKPPVKTNTSAPQEKITKPVE